MFRFNFKRTQTMKIKTLAAIAAVFASATAFAQTAPAPGAAPQQPVPPQLHPLTPAQQAFVQSPQFQQDRVALVTALQAKNDAALTAAKNKLEADSRSFQANFARAPQAAVTVQPVAHVDPAVAAPNKALVAAQGGPQVQVKQLYSVPAGVLPASAPAAKK